MENLKACIFDLDGVLVDTAIYHYQAWRRLAQSLGADFTEAENEELKGISRMESMRLILSWSGLERSTSEMEKLAQQKNEWYLDLIANMGEDEVLPGSRELLMSLQDQGVKIALGSASKNARIILEKTELAPFFNAVIDGTVVSRSKPDPAVFLEGAKALGVAPQSCIVFEDAVSGVQAAINAGMRVIGIGDETVLKQADRVYPSLLDISLGDLNFID